MISARVVCDSVNPDGDRLVSMLVVAPRFLLAEINTHRVFSRNAASSRAVPVEKTLAAVQKDPFVPIHWGKNQKGMSAETEIDDRAEAEADWLGAKEAAVYWASRLKSRHVHKQVTNRLVEPFRWTTNLVSSTEWGNFFNQRCHRDAQPEFRELAYRMLEAYVKSEPARLAWGSWHVPFDGRYRREDLTVGERLKVATARCARLSYENFHGDVDHEDDFRLHDQLMEDNHPSPFEHCACADPEPRLVPGTVVTQPLLRRMGLRSNFVGFVQYRKLLPNENRREFDADALLAAR